VAVKSRERRVQVMKGRLSVWVVQSLRVVELRGSGACGRPLATRIGAAPFRSYPAENCAWAAPSCPISKPTTIKAQGPRGSCSSGTPWRSPEGTLLIRIGLGVLEIPSVGQIYRSERTPQCAGQGGRFTHSGSERAFAELLDGARGEPMSSPGVRASVTGSSFGQSGRQSSSCTPSNAGADLSILLLTGVFRRVLVCRSIRCTGAHATSKMRDQ
jgi:hypothetical protein